MKISISRFQYLIYFLSFLISSEDSSAWSKTGHQIIADIAKHFIDKSTQENVQMYLGSTSFEDAPLWMDEMRSNPTFDFMKPWHYINIEKGNSYVPTTGENIVDRLIITINELKHKQTLCDAQIKTDLLLLFHLMGDLHQPLHVGYGGDRGGNTIKVDFLSVPTNLHSVWDDGIIQSNHITLSDCLSLFPSFVGNNESAWRTLDIIGWMNDTRSHLNEVYNFSGQILD